jgi:hypothetical protein
VQVVPRGIDTLSAQEKAADEIKKKYAECFGG